MRRTGFIAFLSSLGTFYGINEKEHRTGTSRVRAIVESRRSYALTRTGNYCVVKPFVKRFESLLSFSRLSRRNFGNRAEFDLGWTIHRVCVFFNVSQKND